MKSKFIITAILAFSFSLFAGAEVGRAYFEAPLEGAMVGAAFCIGMPVLKYYFPTANLSGFAGLTLYQELFVQKLLEKYRPDGSFLAAVTNDFSGLVDNDTINWAEMGADPEVFVNNATFPIEVAQLSESQVTISLDTLSTQTTRIGNIEQMLLRYSKMEAVVTRHRKALRDYTVRKAAHEYAPGSNTDDTPVIYTTGTTVGGFKNAKISDLINLQLQLDLLDAPNEGRILVLNPNHAAHILAEDATLYKTFTNLPAGMVMNAYGFLIYKTTATPKYHKSTKVKKAWGAAADPSNDTISSFAFCADEVMKAVGSTIPYITQGDTGYRGNLIGYDQRFIAKAIRNKGRVALISEAA